MSKTSRKSTRAREAHSAAKKTDGSKDKSDKGSQTADSADERIEASGDLVNFRVPRYIMVHHAKAKKAYRLDMMEFAGHDSTTLYIVHRGFKEAMSNTVSQIKAEDADCQERSLKAVATLLGKLKEGWGDLRAAPKMDPVFKWVRDKVAEAKGVHKKLADTYPDREAIEKAIGKEKTEKLYAAARKRIAEDREAIDLI